MSKEVLSVGDLTRAIRQSLESGFTRVWVAGEVSNFRRQASGHMYFTLKDAEASLQCVLFAGRGRRVQLPTFGDGDQLQVLGDVSVYALRGQYQLIVEFVQSTGAGALQAQFEALKRRLQAEGLFEQARKRPLPRVPRRVGIVTSPTGAALRDFLNVLGRRAPWVSVLVAGARVQGPGAAEEVAQGLQRLNRLHESGRVRLDVVVLARGGGSLEDLWAFNEEVLARAIAASALPVISAVGHEVDFSIADFTADLRAPTPSAAAELLAPDAVELARGLQGAVRFLEKRLDEGLRQRTEQLRYLTSGSLHRCPERAVREAGQRLDQSVEELHWHAETTLRTRRERLEVLARRLQRCRPQEQLRRRREHLEQLTRRLEERQLVWSQEQRARIERLRGLLRVLGPASVLERGYSITRMAATGQVLLDSAEAPPGTELVTALARGEVRSRATTPVGENAP